jgi:hypothetical protein
VFRTNFLQENTLAIIPPNGYRPKDKQSLLALKWLPYKDFKEDIHIQHARHAGEKRVGNYLRRVQHSLATKSMGASGTVS